MNHEPEWKPRKSQRISHFISVMSAILSISGCIGTGVMVVKQYTAVVRQVTIFGLTLERLRMDVDNHVRTDDIRVDKLQQVINHLEQYATSNSTNIRAIQEDRKMIQEELRDIKSMIMDITPRRLKSRNDNE